MITYLINQGILVGFNLLNVRHDAYRILKHKNIAHAINLAAYAVVVALLIWIFRMGWEGVLFGISAFFNRQLSFDIPLNLRRKLPWYYQSTANPPKAIMDQIEAKLFPGWSGKKIVAVYSLGWVVCLIIKTLL